MAAEGDEPAASAVVGRSFLDQARVTVKWTSAPPSGHDDARIGRKRESELDGQVVRG